MQGQSRNAAILKFWADSRVKNEIWQVADTDVFAVLVFLDEEWRVNETVINHAGFKLAQNLISHFYEMTFNILFRIKKILLNTTISFWPDIQLTAQ